VLAPFALTGLLLPLLRQSGRARVVNVTGGIPSGPIELDNLQGERRYLGWTFSQYNHTKTMLLAVTVALAEDLLGDGVAVNAAYPGHGDTPMNRSMAAGALPVAYRPVVPLIRILAPRFFSDLSRSAASSVYLASSPEMEGVTGVYVDDHSRRRPWPASVLDPSVRAAVCDLCRRLAGIDPAPTGQAASGDAGGGNA
jgi:NAD(P)-dependent dehydrogenase (short-subunit alcohol dehydrogenase family)